MAKIKAGPALLQKPSRRLPSCSLNRPARQASATLCAPVGYPPRSPKTSSACVFPGILQNLPRGVKNPVDMLLKASVRKIDRKKRGSSDGITTCMHSCTPSTAPDSAVFASRISISMVSAAAMQVKVLLFNDITSEDSMSSGDKSSHLGHMIFQKEGYGWTERRN